MDEINENLSNIFSGTELKPAVGHVFINVPHQIYTQFRLSESQGKFFSSKIVKTYKHKKI